MSNRASRLMILALASVGLLLSGCGSEPAEIIREVVTEEVTRVVTEVIRVEAPAVEVTRIVEEIVEVTAVPTISPTPSAAKEITICMVNEPTSLFLYDRPLVGAPALARQAVLHAVYENLYTTLSFDYQPQGLEKLPSLDDGDAEIVTVIARAGDRVVDAQGEVVALSEGTMVRDAEGGEVSFDGTPLTMAQMVVRFRLRPMTWSDGQPVTATDSVFSFEVAADERLQVNKAKIERTAAYEALDELTVQWTGLPGWLDPTYFINVWSPLPAHQLRAYPIEELAATPLAAERPLSNGPFVISEWAAGDYISLVKNEQYYRAAEGLPRLEAITYRFVQNPNKLMALLLAGECDIASQDGLDISQAPLLLEAQANDLLRAYLQANNVFEHVDFGINPDEGYAATRPDWFEDVRVRQAMVMCTDRQAMVDEVLLGLSQVAHAYTPANHPLYPADITEWPYDAAAANTLLSQAGYRDRDGDGLREDPASGQPFRVTLGINLGHQMRQQVAQMFREDMRECGIDVELLPRPAAEWLSPEGSLFGRRFDLAQFPWIVGITPACDLYTTDNIPTRENGWLGNNETGWSDPAYDAACESALDAFVGSDAYRAGHQEALRIFSRQVPIIPLFSHLKLVATAPNVRNLHLDPTQDSELWNIAEIDLAP